MARVVVGLDLGATRIKGGLVDARGGCTALEPVPTEADRGPERVLANLGGLLDVALARARELGHQPVALGVGTPGAVRQPEGTVLGAAENLPGWGGTTVGTPLAVRAGGLSVVVDNDANAATLGEYLFGRACGTAGTVIGLTLGTGVGGGLIVDGALQRGRDGMVGEFGHIGIDVDGRPCPAGGRGCLELYASIRGVEALAAEARAAGCTAAWAGVTGPEIVPAAAAAARAGDADAQAVWDRFGEYLGYGIATLDVTLRPEVVVLMGGLAHAAECFLPAVERVVGEHARLGAPLPVRVGTLGDNAGVQGAAALAWAQLPPD